MSVVPIPEEVETYIQAWRPKGVSRKSAPTPAVLACQELARRAEPQEKLTASVVLAAAWNFVTWRRRHEPTLTFNDVDSLITDEILSTYDTAVDGLAGRPKNTRKNQRTMLRRAGRLEPRHPDNSGNRDDGMADALDLSGTDFATQAVEPEAFMARVLDLPNDVQSVIDDYTPTKVHPTLWARSAPFVRSTVASARPATPQLARAWMRSIGYLVSWICANDRPLRDDVVFADDTIVAFLQAMARGGKASSASSYRSAIIRVRGRITGKQRSIYRLPKHSRVKPPIADADWANLVHWAKHRYDVRTRRGCEALVYLCRGAGLTPGEACCVRPEDFVRRNGLRFVKVIKEGTTHREALILPAFEKPLAAVRARCKKARDVYLTGGSSAIRSERLSILTNPRTRENRGLQLPHREMRTAYVFDVMQTRGLTYIEMLNSLGLAGETSLEPYNRAFRIYTAAQPEAEAS